MKRQLILVALAAVLAGPSAFAVTDAQLKAVKKSVNAVPVAELPAKAAELVTQAAKEDRELVAVTAVRAAIYKSRASAPLVVAAVSKAAPEVAAPVSRVAAELEAGQSGSITAAAVGAAPQAKTAIVSSVQQGVYGGSLSSSSSASTASFSGAPVSPGVSSVSSLSSSPIAFTPRGAADSVHSGHVEHHNTPINEEHENNGLHGEGNRGRFPEHPPFGVVPPGHDPGHHGRPDFVDYTKPRHF